MATLIKKKVKVSLDVEIYDTDMDGDPTILHLSHPKLDGVLEIYLDKGEVPEDRLELIECYDPEDEDEENYGAKYNPFNKSSNPSVISLPYSTSTTNSSSTKTTTVNISSATNSLDSKLVKLAGVLGSLTGKVKKK